MTQKDIDKLNGLGRMILTWSSVIGVLITVGLCAGMVKENTTRSIKNEAAINARDAIIVEMATDIKWIKAELKK